MTTTWLVLDSNSLCWRAHHTTGSLSYRGRPTGVIYGFLRAVLDLQDLHNTDRVAFCFDYSRKHLYRRVDYPPYKANRDDKFTLEHKQTYRQIKELRTEILPSLGYQNIFAEKGYEADDLIASIVGNLRQGHEAIIVGGDQDFYQLLGPRTIIWNPTSGKAITAESFSKEFGVTPTQWIDVKAIAGCNGDNVKGICGIGEKTACQFLNGTLDPKSNRHRLIASNNKIWKRNKPLVKLPYPDTPIYKLRRDEVTRAQWKKVCKTFGLKSLQPQIAQGFDL